MSGGDTPHIVSAANIAARCVPVAQAGLSLTTLYTAAPCIGALSGLSLTTLYTTARSRGSSS
jgi:hypothetical protein